MKIINYQLSIINGQRLTVNGQNHSDNSPFSILHSPLFRVRQDAKRSAFSLLEILIAITIITILGAVVGVGLLKQIDRSKANAAKMQIAELKTAVVMYAAENGAIPTPQQGLDALVRPTTIPPLPKPFNPGDFFDAQAIPLDPWGREYYYCVPGRNGESFEIICYGADGEEGGDGVNADISSSQK